MTTAPSTSAASIEEVLSIVSRYARPLACERVSLAESIHRILRESIYAQEDQPPFDRSAMDGYAIGANDPSMSFTVVDQIRAGECKPRILSSGEAVQIATGAALPGTGLRVVLKEDVERTGDQALLLRRTPEHYIRFKGEDARKGELLIEAGSVLRPGTVALLAGVGCTQPLVTRQPRVLHVATGNEIVPPESTPLPGQIRDSNSILVQSFLSQWHIVPEQIRLPEEKPDVLLTLNELETPDLLLISGGASVGDHDFTREVLEQLGYTICIHKTNARPGKPLLFGTRDNSLAFGLPGNPLAHFVCLNLYVRAALEGLFGSSERLTSQSGVLTAELDGQNNSRETLWPAQVAGSNLTPLHWSSSGDLTPLATANALARIPSETGRLCAGSPILFFPTVIFP